MNLNLEMIYSLILILMSLTEVCVELHPLETIIPSYAYIN